MNTLKYLLLAVGLALGSPDLADTAAHADTHGRIAIYNGTTGAIKYWFQWGDGDPVECTVASGKGMLHTHPLDAAGRAPRPSIHFPNGAGFNWTSYRLEFYGSSNQPKRYIFRWTTAGPLDLLSRK